MSTNEVDYGIAPQDIYRKSDPATRKILGLGATAVDEAIRDGTLPAPLPLTAHGKAQGWYGWQLINVIKQRLAAAATRQVVMPPQLVRKKKKKQR
jgi:hypothetical protein